jgi:tripeptidyl-peptidase-1
VFHLRRVHSEQVIEDAFAARSTPGSTLFQEHLSVAELQNLVRGDASSHSAVAKYLDSTNGCSRPAELSLLKDSLVCDIVAGSELALLLARSVSAKSFAPRTGATHLMPVELQTHLRAVVVQWARQPGVAAPRKTPTRLTEPGMTQTPSTIRSRYHVPTRINFTIPANYSNGVGEFEGEYFTASDLVTFASKYHLEHPLAVSVLGPNPEGGADQVEGELDLEYMGAVSNGRVPLWWLAQSGNHQEPGNIDFHLWVNKVLALPNPPAVVSLSWGMGYQRYFWDMTVLTMDNDAFRNMGLAGISLLAASGDSGPGTRSEVFNCNVFVPSWPSSSPYLTSVGATYANSASSEEMSVDWSGGGFSTVFARPSWQNAAVEAYLSSTPNLPKSSFYNASGRGYPDVSALGTNFECIISGQVEAVSGTSAASPTFAGIIGLVAAERKAQGKPALGFLNPLLYKIGSVGFDVTQGASQDTNCFPLFPLPGFPATKGWDAVSGLGTPRYDFLREKLMM